MLKVYLRVLASKYFDQMQEICDLQRTKATVSYGSSLDQ